MPKINRWLEPGAVFHVMNRGVEGRTLFVDDRDRLRFMGLLREMQDSYQCRVLAYCLMGNHFHLVMADHGCHLSKAIRILSLKYALRFNMRHGRDGPLFRGRFKSVRILSEDQLKAVIEYIHFNPLKDGFVKNPIDWDWSSYKFYENQEAFPRWLLHSSSLFTGEADIANQN
jgi:putative transposase